ncbi:MAG: hypothetical protein ACK583_17690, partial [Cyanobacteriota bacterium]
TIQRRPTRAQLKNQAIQQQHQQEYKETGTTKLPGTLQKQYLRLTSQPPESVLYSAQRHPEHNTGNSGSARDHPSGERAAAGQSTAEQRL